ncbi:MAG: N-acetyl-gamma-glutamyl-phosphate reductase [Gammaproteobacteria bacterium]
MTRLGLVGARGHTGAELIKLIDDHPTVTLALASSRSNAGQRVADQVAGIKSDLVFCETDAAMLHDCDLDALILALPNHLAAPFVDAWQRGGHDGPVIDLSADYRFDSGWHYGLPELNRENQNGCTRIANPGCYATAMQLALSPLRDLIEGVPMCFGVSGFSGAGTTPSDKNNPQTLADNLIPYAPFDHVHEREVSAQLGTRVRFVPHVAAFFRGILMTVTANVKAGTTLADITDRLHAAYADEPLVRVQDDAPWVADNAERHHACVAGAALRDGELTLYATLDNLLKGAATQALQNLNLACGHNELEGIPSD